jgi:DNA polymerase-4
MRKVILHIDFDSFFASVEQQLDPRLRGRPVGITATNGRNCIIAASREAKREGISSPSRTFEAKKICPSIVFVPAHFGEYWEISKKFLKICSSYSPFVEVFSIDEVFMDVTQTAHLFGGVPRLIETIKKRLAGEIGEYVTASVGVSYNKMLAKLASGLKKPNGVMFLNPEDVISVYEQAKLTDICGIGERIRLRLNQIGIFTLIQLRLAPLSSLLAEFGEVEGKFLKNVGMAIDTRPIVPYTQAPGVKSVGRNYCLPENEYDMRVVLQHIYELCEEVTLKLRRLGKKARTVGIYLRGKQSVHGRRTYLHYIDTGKDMFECCLRSLQLGQIVQGVPRFTAAACAQLSYVRQIGVWASNLESRSCVPSSLFVDEAKRDKVLAVVDRLNEKFGHHTIRNGFLLQAPQLTTVPNGFMADTYERTKLAEDFEF